MERADTLTGARKRAQIRTANKVVFAWIIGASVVLGICGVLAQFLFRQMMYNGSIYNETAKTNATLESNIKAYDGLKSEVTKLVADSNLALLRKGENSTALQVIIDAMPTEENRAALATSMQTEVLGPSGVSINSFSAVDSTGAVVPTGSGGVKSFGLSFTVTGSYAQVNQAIRNIERSIRPINIQSIDIQGTDSQLRASVVVAAYFQPAQVVQLKEVKRP